jgi:DNA-binding IclR family transcriptional regulator
MVKSTASSADDGRAPRRGRTRKEMQRGDNSRARGIQAVSIAFHILDRLASAKGPMPLGDLAHVSDMTPSKLRFYLVSFLQLGLVNQDPLSGHYSLGPHAIRIGLSALEQLDVITASKRALYELVERFGFSAFLAVWGTHGPTIVFRVDGRQKTVLEIRVGTVLPLFNSAIGRIFCAYMPNAVTAPIARRELSDRSRNGISRSAARTLIDATRRNGIAVARGTLLVNFTAIAAPVMDYSGLPVAAVSVVGPVGALDDSLSGKPAQALRAMAEELSSQLGWRGAEAVRRGRPAGPRQEGMRRRH